MRAIGPLTDTGGAAASLTGGKVELLGAEFNHTTDANVVITVGGAAGGQEIMTLKTTDEKETDWRWFGEHTYNSDSDFWYDITTGGSLTLWVK